MPMARVVTGKKLGRIRLGRELTLQFAQRLPLVIAEHNAPPMRVKNQPRHPTSIVSRYVVRR